MLSGVVGIFDVTSSKSVKVNPVYVVAEIVSTTNVPLTVNPVIVLIDALKSTPSFLLIVNVFALSYVNPVTNVSLTSIVDKSKVYVVPSFLVNVANAVPLSYVEPVVNVSVTPVISIVTASFLVKVIVSVDSL